MQFPQIITGPAIITHRGRTYYSEGDIRLEMARETFDIKSSQHGITDSRHKQQTLRVSFTAVGQPANIDHLINVLENLYPGQTLVPGIGAPMAFTAEADNETITSAAHGLSNGDRFVMLDKTGGAEYSTSVVYYVIDSATNTFKAALTSGGSAVAITTDVTAGTLAKVNETPLVIWPLYNGGGTSRIWTLPRAGITTGPTLKFSGTSALSAEVTFTALESAALPGTSTSWLSSAAWSAPTTQMLEAYDAASVVSAAVKLVWATDPDALASGDVQIVSKDGWTYALTLPTKPHEVDGHGLVDVLLGADNINAMVTGDAATIYDHNGIVVPESQWPTLMGFSTPKPGQPGTRKQLRLVLLYNDAATGMDAGQFLMHAGTAEWTSLGNAWSGGENPRSGAVAFKIMPTWVSGARVMGGTGLASASNITNQF